MFSLCWPLTLLHWNLKLAWHNLQSCSSISAGFLLLTPSCYYFRSLLWNCFFIYLLLLFCFLFMIYNKNSEQQQRLLIMDNSTGAGNFLYFTYVKGSKVAWLCHFSLHGTREHETYIFAVEVFPGCVSIPLAANLTIFTLIYVPRVQKKTNAWQEGLWVVTRGKWTCFTFLELSIKKFWENFTFSIKCTLKKSFLKKCLKMKK